MKQGRSAHGRRDHRDTDHRHYRWGEPKRLGRCFFRGCSRLRYRGSRPFGRRKSLTGRGLSGVHSRIAGGWEFYLRGPPAHQLRPRNRR